MQIETSIKHLRKRSKLLRSMREFFIRRGFLEVQTPCLGAYPCNEAHLNPMAIQPTSGQGGDSAPETTTDRAHQWLHTSPESAMKRLLARTEQDIFQIAPVFRAGEMGSQHREEFTMLEWYRVGHSWQQLLDETFQLLRKCGLKYNRVTQFTWLEWVEAHYEYNLMTLADDQLIALAHKHHLHSTDNRAAMIDFLFDLSIDKAKNKGELYVITHYPSQWAINAKRDEDPDWSTRFECFYQGLEIVNGCAEVNDPAEQAQRFATQNQLRRDAGKPELDIDKQWLEEMTHMPRCSGAALGIDRLLMAIHDIKDITELNPLNQPLHAN